MPRPCSCDRVPAKADEYVSGDHCALCTIWRLHPDSPAARSWRGESLQTGRTFPLSPVPFSCVHLGTDTGAQVGCRTCSGLVSMPVMACAVFGGTVLGDRGPASDTIKACRWCDWNPQNDRKAKYFFPAEPVRTMEVPVTLTRVGPTGLFTGRLGWAFNGGLLRHAGKLLVPYRTDWTGSQCHVAGVTEDYQVLWSKTLRLDHELAPVGQEDPRLFLAGDELRLHFIGVEKGRTSQLYARLSDEFEVKSVHYPVLENRQEPKEKNWSPFWHDGEHLAVYTPGPYHRVVRIAGDTATRIAETPATFPWSGGHLRGGAPPVRVGDLYYHWFHGRVGPDSSPWYNVGLSVFEAKVPFRVVAQSPHPFLWGDLAENLTRDKSYACTAFVQGAVLEDGKWKLGMGWNDRRIMVAELSQVAVDQVMGL